jgi:transcriptional regulator with XRE-family HTH domain
MEGHEVQDTPTDATTLMDMLLQEHVLRRLGVSLRQLADRIGCGEQSLRRLRLGYGVRNETAKNIANYLRVKGPELYRERTREEAVAALERYLKDTGLRLFGVKEEVA